MLSNNQSLVTTSTRVTIEVEGAADIQEKDILLLMDNDVNINFTLISVEQSEVNETIKIIECELLSTLEVGAVLLAKVARAGHFSNPQTISDFIQNGIFLFFISKVI